MKLKEFEWALQEIKQFDKPKVKWEQYPTSEEASRVIFIFRIHMVILRISPCWI